MAVDAVWVQRRETMILLVIRSLIDAHPEIKTLLSMVLTTYLHVGLRDHL